MKREFSDQEQVRRNKIEELKKLGVEPFGKAFKAKNSASEIISKYQKYSKAKLEKEHIIVSIAGRIVLKRGQGKAGFMHIKDGSSKIQVYMRCDNLSKKDFATWKLSDLGDIVGVSGYLFRTNTGELTIHVEKYTHLSKALKPLPEKFHGLQNIEEGRRKRYLDLITDDKSYQTAIIRTKTIRAFQEFFDNEGYIEVETPILQSILGGANARPFKTHHNALHMDFYLRIATEIALKKLVVGGINKVYEIGRLFRNEGMDSMHNPEFTTIEAYSAFDQMPDVMKTIEKAFKFVVKKVLGKTEIVYQDFKIDFSKPFKKIHMVDAIKGKTGIDFFKINDFNTACEIASKHHIEVEKHFKIGHIINAFFEKYVEQTLLQPTFVYGHPLDISPLAKKNKDNPNFTDRFEMFILGSEYANAYSELNDPIDQEERFIEQVKEKEKGNEETVEMDYDFIEALEYGLPPTGGLGIGIDRFIMLLTDSKSIRDVILFPHLKEKE